MFLAIDDHFANLEIGHTDTLKQTIDSKNSFVHFTKDDGYVTKSMSTHGTLHEISSHHTMRVVGDQVKSFNYVEPLSRYNVAKHYINDVNDH